MGFIRSLNGVAIGVAWIALASSVPAMAKPLGVDLHAHLFMKEGLGIFFRGDFHSELKAVDSTDALSSQANEEALEQSNLGLVVAALYAHPFFKLSLKDSIRAQINLANSFISKHPNWILAKTPEEAQTALLQKKRILILSLEGADGILESDEDIEEFISRGGIRIVNLLHLTDDKFGGVAFLGSFRAWSTPVAFFLGFFNRRYDSNGNWVNANGLTPEGKNLARRLISKQVWLDLAHMSDQSQLDLKPLLDDTHQPLLYTHTSLRNFFPAERAISDEQLKTVNTTGGMIGLVPSPMMLESKRKEATCSGTLEALLEHYQEALKSLSSERISIGSDWNGTIPHLKPPSPTCPLGSSSCNSPRAAEFCSKGLWNIGQSEFLWDQLTRAADWRPSPSAFISVWRRAWLRP